MGIEWSGGVGWKAGFVRLVAKNKNGFLQDWWIWI